jgi:YidC/Oxa1 family membrane protein insertase
MSILRAQFLKFLPLTLLIIAISFGLTTFQPVKAAPPDNPAALNQIVEKSGVTLEKIASHEAVPLGQVVSYTVTIKNGSDRAIEATLTDALPVGLLALQHQPISATVGAVTTTDNTLAWSGSLASGDTATIIYDAIPPSHAAPDQKVANMARLKFGETTLEAGATITTQKADLGIWGIFVNFLALILIWTNDLLAKIGVPFSFGFAIIVFTVAVRLATYPLNTQQIKSSKAMQELQPKMKELQEKYKNDKEKLAQEQMSLYKEHGVNPLGGCLPMLVQMTVWFALYQSLMQLSKEGLLNQGFLWIPSLAGPVSYGNGGLGWLWPLPPAIGWWPAIAYLILPVLLVVSQLYMQNMMTPPSTDPQQASMQSAMKIMPIMFGYFALVVPSGLSLYWFTSNMLAMAQQYFTQNRSQAAPVVGKTPTKMSSLPKIELADPDLNDSDLADTGGNTQSQNVKSKRKRRRK